MADIQILEYIRKHPGTTMNKVAHHINRVLKILSYVPTLTRIDDLIQQGVIQDKKEDNSFHRLYIDYENEFNILYQYLTEAERVLDRMHTHIRKISEMYGRFRRNKANDFKKQYQFFFMWTFHALLVRTAHGIQSERESRTLFRKIVELMLKFDNQFSEFDYYDFTSGGNFFEEDLHPSVKNIGIDEKSINDLRQLNYDISHILQIEQYDVRSKAYERRRRQMGFKN